MIHKLNNKVDMIASMTPAIGNQDYVFVMLTEDQDTSEYIKISQAIYHEKEGMSLVVPLSFAKEKGFAVSAPMKCITLNVYSDLEGVGLTAEVAGALADNNIPCNVIAAYHHDYT